MGTITFVLLTNKRKIPKFGSIKIVRSNGKNLISVLSKIKTKYVAFLREEDQISELYFERIYQKIEEDFDSCFINYDILFKKEKQTKILQNEEELSKNIPYVYEYIWSYIFRTKKLLKILEIPYDDQMNDRILKTFKKRCSIGEVLYYHNPVNPYLDDKVYYKDVKYAHYYKNIIYIADGCNCVFNGYVSWIRNIGRCFGKDYDITILYDVIWEPTLHLLEKQFRCVKRNYYENYCCDRMIDTYSTVYYPKNIICFEMNALFIHGVMEDFKELFPIYYDDIYSRYICVSEASRKKSIEFFPNSHLETILNPFSLEGEEIRPHLKLVSCQRTYKGKGMERIKKFASILDLLEIPYTWNVFTDAEENTNHKGLIMRERVYNVLPYVQDSDYFVLLSDSEAMPYSAIEALSLHTKVIGTPLDAFKELGIIDKENGYFIPFEYFDDQHDQELSNLIIEIYQNMYKPIEYQYTNSFYEGYQEIFKK